MAQKEVKMSSIWTEADITTLKNTILQGVLTVHYAGPPARTVTYQSLEAMKDLLAQIRAEVNADDSPRTTYAYSRKGF